MILSWSSMPVHGYQNAKCICAPHLKCYLHLQLNWLAFSDISSLCCEIIGEKVYLFITGLLNRPKLKRYSHREMYRNSVFQWAEIPFQVKIHVANLKSILLKVLFPFSSGEHVFTQNMASAKSAWWTLALCLLCPFEVLTLIRAGKGGAWPSTVTFAPSMFAAAKHNRPVTKTTRDQWLEAAQLSGLYILQQLTKSSWLKKKAKRYLSKLDRNS